MTAIRTQKAKNLAKLRSLGFNVPDFSVIPRANPIVPLVAKSNSIILRGASVVEDSPYHSHAGQSKTVGPVFGTEVQMAIDRMFRNDQIDEIIVQDFIDAPTGVLFCFSSNEALLEFARAPRFVTDGIGEPFSAVFPNSHPQYKAIQNLLPQLFSSFGSCNVELSVEEIPKLFQVRPITAEIELRDELSELKMQLQELSIFHLIRNEFSIDLEESPGFESEIIKLYCANKRSLFKELKIDTETEFPTDFLRIGRRIFLENKSLSPDFPNGWRAFRLGSWIVRMLYEYRRDTVSELTPDKLMSASFAVRILAQMIERLPEWLANKLRRKLLNLRNEIRRNLILRLYKSDLIATVETKLEFESPIVKDTTSLTWQSLKEANAEGKTVVPGDFSDGPFVIMKNRDDQLIFPNEKSILVCTALFPEIYTYFPNIKGVISEGGAITSHLAILAREVSMPLRIGVCRATERFYSVK